MHNYSFYNEYDDHGRITFQKVPGGSQTTTLYDNRGRVAMTQNWEQLMNNQWAFVKYDNLDRPIMTGIVEGGIPDERRNALAQQTIFGEEWGTAIHGYTNHCYPSANANDVLTVTYYDDYQWLTDTDYNYSTADAISGTTVDNVNVVGLTTGTKTKVLGVDGDQWLTSATYYDSKYRSIQSVSDLWPSGREVVSNSHNFAGDVIQTKVKQTVGGQSYGYTKTFNYDNLGRLLDIEQVMSGTTEPVTIASYTYDDMNRVFMKKIHNDLETTEYSYDLLGRQTGVKSRSFEYKLWFDKAPVGLSGRKDGNLSHVTWGNRGGYSFTYDAFGQLADARGIGSSDTYREKFAYDMNGNITKLERYDGAVLVNNNVPDSEA